ncbi:MAG: lysophospholipase [Chloroflexota bacterium]
MKHIDGAFQGANGIQLYYQCWQPDDQPIKAVLAIVHGIGEHSGRHINLVRHIVQQGYMVYGFDHRGHGQSPGQRGHINDWSEFRGDVRAFVHMVGDQQPDLPLFLLGHSMGGVIMLDYVRHHPDGLRAIIASSPALGDVGVPPILLFLGRIISRIWPSFSFSTGLDVSYVSRDPKEVQKYKDDPLNHGKGTARLSAEVEKTMAATQDNAVQYTLPMLVYHGSGDKITSAKASRQFFDKVTSADKRYILYDGGYHELTNDLDRDKVFADVESWLETHL